MKKLENLIDNAGIISTDRAAVSEIFNNYYKKNKNKAAPEKISFFSNFVFAYQDLRKRGENEGRSLFVKAMHKASDLSNGYVHIGRALSLCNGFLGVSKKSKGDEKLSEVQLNPKTMGLWVRSLDHLDKAWSDYPTGSERLGRYLVISQSYLKGNASEDHVLNLIVEKGPLYGLEKFMFSLTRDQSLDASKAEIYFTNLKKIPIDAREKVEETRRKIRQGEKVELDLKLYNFFSLKSQTAGSRRSSAALMYNITKFSVSNPTDHLKKVLGTMGEIIEKDETLMQPSVNDVTNLFKLQESKKYTGLIQPYLQVVRHVAGLKVSSEEKPIYAHFASELFEDYYRSKRLPKVRGIQEKCYDSINGFISLGGNARSIALELLNTSMEKLKRDSRLGRAESSRLYLDKLAKIITKAVSKNPTKARKFIGRLVDYKDYSRGGT